jgi:hypothetical protein
LASPVFSQSFSASYRTYCINKINSSIQQRALISSDTRDKTDEKINSLHTRFNEILNDQIKALTAIFKDAYKNTGFNFNKADSLTIIFQTNNKSCLSDFIIISGKHTLKSTKRLALCREVNNGGGKLEPLNKDAAAFKVYKTFNSNIGEPFLALALKADTAYAYAADIYCPVSYPNTIITAKRRNGRYKIWDYYLHGFSFVAISK